MENNEMGKLFYTEIMDGLFQISDKTENPTKIEKSIAPGIATRNSYLIIGDSEAVLFDLALDNYYLKDFVESLTNKPIKLVLGHAHYDHVFNLNRYSNVFMHKGDESLIKDGSSIVNQSPTVPCPQITYLNNGDKLDLGNRTLEVIHIPGHSDGSILLLDRKTRTLLTSDTIARRLLFGLHSEISLEGFCSSLQNLLTLEFDVFYSCHDRCALPKSYINKIISIITNTLSSEELATIDLPNIGPLSFFKTGDETNLSYFDIALPTKYLD